MNTLQRCVHQTAWATVTTFALLGACVASAADPMPAADVAGDLQKRLAAAAAADRDIPRDTFDPQAIIERVGRDPEKLFAWVRDNTFWVPYHGSLRGPTGVLMDRLGNSLDRSLLLAELLQTAGNEVQLAHADLPEAQARQLMSSLRAPSAERLNEPAEDATARGQRLDAYAARFGLDAAAMHRAIERIDREAAALSAEAKARLASQVPLVLAALGDAPARDAAARAKKSDDARVAALADHWWVQRRRGADAWEDFDVLTPDGAAAKSIATPTGTVRFVQHQGAPVMPDGAAHDVVVKVIAERCAGGKLSEAVALEHVLRPAALYGRHVALQTAPLSGPALPKAGASKTFDADYKAAALAHKEWLPKLSIGREQVSQKSVRDDGSVNEKPSLNPAGVVGDANRGLFGGLGGAVGGNSGGNEAASALTALWVQYEIRSPGDKPRVIRQPIFDIIGPAARAAGTTAQPTIDDAHRLDRGLAMLGEVQILPLGCNLSHQFVDHMMGAALTYNLGKAAALARDAGAADPRSRRDFIDRARELEYLPGPLESVALFRQSWAPQRGRIYLDRVNVLTLISRPATAVDQRLVERRVFDVIANEVAALGDEDAFRARLEQGIVDTIAEDLVLNGAAATATPAAGEEKSAEPSAAVARVRGLSNTSAQFAAGGPALQLSLVRGADDAAYKQMQLPADVRATIDAVLAAGQAAVLPRGPVQIANATEPRVVWYRVDLAAGTSIGMADNGYHSANAEYEQLNARVSQVFGNPNLRMQHVAEASQQEVYQWFASRFGHSPDLMRACINLREACINALAIL
jgi:hypothetical protein